MFVNFFGCKVTPTMLQTFCYRVTIRLQRRGRPLFFFCARPHCYMLHVTCYMLHVTLRPPTSISASSRSADKSCKRSSQIHVALVAWSRIVTCYMLHVTLRSPPLPPPPPREALYLLFSCFPADLCFFYSLAREKSNCSPPPSRLLTRMLPRWRMTAFLTMASPSPVPPSDRLRPLSTR